MGRFPLTNTFSSVSVAGENSVTDSSPWLVTHMSVPSNATPMGVLNANVDPDRDATNDLFCALTTVTVSAALLATNTRPSATARPVGSSNPNLEPETVPTNAPEAMANSVMDPTLLRTNRSGPEEAKAMGS